MLSKQIQVQNTLIELQFGIEFKWPELFFQYSKTHIQLATIFQQSMPRIFINSFDAQTFIYSEFIIQKSADKKMGSRFCRQVPTQLQQHETDPMTPQEVMQKLHPQQKHEQNQMSSAYGAFQTQSPSFFKQGEEDTHSTLTKQIPINTPKAILRRPSKKTSFQNQSEFSNTNTKQNFNLEKFVRRDLLSPSKQIFFKANMRQFNKMFNQYIKTVPNPVQLDECVSHIPYQSRPQKYVIQRQLLPDPGNNMPNWWIYVGQWHNFLPHGKGRLYHKDFIYEGYFHKGIPHLKGRYMAMDSIYEGGVNMNLREGFGRLVTKKQSYFEGEWKKGKREGKGFEIHQDGSVFEGVYFDNKVQKGILVMPKDQVLKKKGQIDNEAYVKLCKKQWKEKYSGEFFNNKFEGWGIYNWADKRRYEGQWSKGMMSGEGTFTWPNGKIYKGEYWKNRKDGYGRFEANGKIYQGMWADGLPDGKGKLIRGKREEFKTWKKGKIEQSQNPADEISMFSHCSQEIACQSAIGLRIPTC